ncbi:inosine-5'-monophosphate dehydrogenase [Acetivibrio straminisolvens JCM 21531]|uniref:Inosine-5'-monophosphate dehydrogenase n=1 Tax=Acetivibrio straminisolvens JCM 21531 TaxID=1294263 RepID=W4V6P0_9FIRM|nr:inosine-5'-monophosphate dehydrogenase [Acetivibrio straminisolvens JCM 21531]
MAYIYNDVSRTFSEYLLIPNLTTEKCTPDNIDLSTPMVKFKKDENCSLKLNIPIVSAIMQSVSNDTLAIALARCGGLSFIYGSQSIEKQADMVKKVKKYKSGFVVSDSNLTIDSTLKDVIDLKSKTGHSTIAITDDGTSSGKLLGLVTTRDYRISRDPLDKKVKDFMTPFSKLVVGKLGISLSEANDIIWGHKLNCLPIVDDEQRLHYLVFRKDYDDHKQNPYELLDSNKRLRVGAGINTRDYKERVPALVEAGVDALCIDSSDGFSVWQKYTLDYIKSNYDIKVGAGNVVDREGFLYLAEAGADFVKIGIGGGSICITREQKGIGRGQATAVIEVAKARMNILKKPVYIFLYALTAVLFTIIILFWHWQWVLIS